MSTRVAAGWALLFSVPPAVGVTGYASMIIGEQLVEPLALAAGGLTAAVIFALVFASQATGSPQPAAVRERVD